MRAPSLRRQQAQPPITEDELAVSAMCRDLRHAWQHDTDVIHPFGSKFERHLICVRCGTVRIDSFAIDHRHATLTRQGSRYRYAPGYHIRGGVPLSTLRYRLLNLIQKGI